MDSDQWSAKQSAPDDGQIEAETYVGHSEILFTCAFVGWKTKYQLKDIYAHPLCSGEKIHNYDSPTSHNKLTIYTPDKDDAIRSHLIVLTFLLFLLLW
jgi:hypothetical protein